MFGGVVVPAVIDLFAGAGGLSLGAARAGFDVCAAVEIDPHAITSHRTNFPNTVHIQRNIMSLTGANIIAEANIRQQDLIGIIGGPPARVLVVLDREMLTTSEIAYLSSFLSLLKICIHFSLLPKMFPES